MDGWVNNFNVAVTETANETLGQYRHKKLSWVTLDILHLCDKRRELKEDKFKTKNAKQYKAVNQQIKKEKKNWRGGVSLRSSSGHPGVESWGAETNGSLGGHPRVEAKSGGGGGGGEAIPLFQMTTRNGKGERTRPDGRPGSKAEPVSV